MSFFFFVGERLFYYQFGLNQLRVHGALFFSFLILPHVLSVCGDITNFPLGRIIGRSIRLVKCIVEGQKIADFKKKMGIFCFFFKGLLYSINVCRIKF